VARGGGNEPAAGRPFVERRGLPLSTVLRAGHWTLAKVAIGHDDQLPRPMLSTGYARDRGGTG